MAVVQAHQTFPSAFATLCAAACRATLSKLGDGTARGAQPTGHGGAVGARNDRESRTVSEADLPHRQRQNGS